MMLLLSIYVIIALSLISSAIFLKGMFKKIALSLTIGLVILPLCFILLVAIFRSSIQQGKFLSKSGPILILIAPPKDLHEPLGIQNLDPNKREYRFEFQHKYVGNHDVNLSFRKLESMESAHTNLEILYAVSIDGRNVFSQTSQKGWPYWGMKNSGLMFISYNVPQDLPVGKKLSLLSRFTAILLNLLTNTVLHSLLFEKDLIYKNLTSRSTPDRFAACEVVVPRTRFAPRSRRLGTH